MTDKQLHEAAMESMLDAEKCSPGAMRAAEKCAYEGHVPRSIDDEKRWTRIFAEIIDRETGLKELQKELDAVKPDRLALCRANVEKHEGKTP